MKATRQQIVQFILLCVFFMIPVVLLTQFAKKYSHDEDALLFVQILICAVPMLGAGRVRATMWILTSIVGIVLLAYWGYDVEALILGLVYGSGWNLFEISTLMAPAVFSENDNPKVD